MKTELVYLAATVMGAAYAIRTYLEKLHDLGGTYLNALTLLPALKKLFVRKKLPVLLHAMLLPFGQIRGRHLPHERRLLPSRSFPSHHESSARRRWKHVP